MSLIVRIATIGIAIAMVSALGRPATASATIRPVLFNYDEGWHHGKVKPTRIFVGANAPYFTGLAWSHWTSTAYGRGTLHQQSTACMNHHPSYQCPYVGYRGSVRLWHVKTYRGRLYFSEMKWRYHTGTGRQRSETWRVTSEGYFD
jgi:hypothetical protein